MVACTLCRSNQQPVLLNCAKFAACQMMNGEYESHAIECATTLKKKQKSFLRSGKIVGFFGE